VRLLGVWVCVVCVRECLLADMGLGATGVRRWEGPSKGCVSWVCGSVLCVLESVCLLTWDLGPQESGGGKGLLRGASPWGVGLWCAC